NYSPSSRINAGALDLYTADSSGAYQRVEPASWQLAQSGEEYVFELREPLAGRFLKVHSKYDDRDQALNFVDQVTFRNSLGASLKIEQILAFEEREYEYDPLGNRTRESVKLLGTKTQEYSYYANSNRLLTDGQFAYVYDANGNLIRKGNSYELVGESVLFTRTTGEDVLYWEYSYDLANRLVAVNKNGVPVVSYTYDPLGLRVERVTDGQRVHYLFNLSGELIWERNLEKNEESSYIWWNGEHLAKVEGKPTDSLAVRFFYHTDLLGSPMVVTDSSGEVVWRQDYLPFGERIEQERAYAYAQTHGLTGKEYDEAIGLYYYNARWYDPELGRFITEDPARVGVNWYIYCYNNPLYFIDASGMIPTPLEAAYMAQHVHGYSDGKKYPLRGDWVARDNMLITGGDGMIMGVYSKTHPDGTLEYALVSKGSSLAFGDMWEQTKSDWKNNGQQLFGESEDVIAGIAKSIAFVRKHSGIEITFIGHSKGGAEAAANAVATNKNAILFNPMTVNLKAYQGTNKDKAEKYSASMTAFIVEGEILNKVFGPISKPIDKKVDLSQKHNTKSWYIPDALKTINSIRNHLMDAVIWGLRKDGYK
ncbi:MAG TPA: hypothetical protein DEG09_02870, partial [Marinilabiliaceae bacterium]|nr:hypothetical protein [Marinilabiliaceae bacterium]